jgi:hypothetical protein
MSWTRLDDAFCSDKLIVRLSDHEFRVFLRLLCHCGKQEDPTVDKITIKEVPGLTPHMVAKMATRIGTETSALLDQVGDCYEVHDWAHFQPKDKTGADRQAAWRARHTVTKVTKTSRARVKTNKLVPVPEEQKQEQEPCKSNPDGLALPTRENPIWNVVSEIWGEPLSNGKSKAARGLIVSNFREILARDEITEGEAQKTEIRRRHAALAADWGNGKATARSLVNNWKVAGQLADGSGKLGLSAEDMARQAIEDHERGL